MSEPRMTTAAVLGQYQSELAESCILGDLQCDLIRDAAHMIHLNEGVSVKESSE